jgi:hypothetical protein
MTARDNTMETTMQTQRIEIPSVFDGRGIFVPLAECDLEQLPDHIVALYQKVADAYSAMTMAERLVTEKTAELHRVVAEQRDFEAKAAAHKITHTALVKDWIASQR